jgi:hypothetical protein
MAEKSDPRWHHVCMRICTDPWHFDRMEAPSDADESHMEALLADTRDVAELRMIRLGQLRPPFANPGRQDFLVAWRIRE